MYKVIVVDDEQMERRAVTHILNNSTLPVTIAGEAADGVEAVELFFDVCPDIVLIDIKMPCKDGLEAAFEMMKSGTDAVTIFLTAYDEFEYAQKAVRLGALDYVLKPVRPDEVVKTVYRAIKELENRKRRKSQRKEQKTQTDPGSPAVHPSPAFDATYGDRGLEDLKKLAGFLELDDAGKIILVMDVDASRGDDADNRLIRTGEAKHKICSIINEEKNTFSTVLIASTHPDKVAVLVCFKQGQQDDGAVGLIHGWADTIQKEYGRAGLGSITFGIGKLFKDLNRIHESCRGAKKAFQTEPFPAETNRDPHMQGHVIEENRHAADSREKARMLRQHMANRKWEHVKKDFKEWFIETVRSDIPAYTKKTSIARMVVSMSKTAIEAGAEKARVFALVAEYHNRLCVSDCLMDMADYSILIIGELEELICACHKTYSARIIAQATLYIQNHFCENIRMNEVARAVNLSPHYFSRLFKKETNTTFLDYLTHLRIDKAKQLLRDQSITINEIAQEVGYYEACYFSRVFKKHERLSPSEYRAGITKCS